MRAFAHSREAPLVDALFHQCGHNCFGALLAQRVVDGVGARVVAVALHLEVQVGVLLHQLGHAVDFHERFRLEVGLARLEGDGVRDNLAFRGQAVVERHSALGNAHIAQSRVAIERATGEEEVAWGLHHRHVDQAHAVHVALESPLVEREGEVVPFAGDHGVVFLQVVAVARVQPQHLLATRQVVPVGFQQVPREVARAVLPVPEVHIARGVVVALVAAVAERDAHIERCLFFGLAWLGHVEVELNGEHLGQPIPFLLHQRDYLAQAVVGERQHVAPFLLRRFRVAVQQVPSQRELAESFVLEIVVEEYFVAGDEIGLRIVALLSLCGHSDEHKHRRCQ